jgi:hypothetical protein
MDGYFSSETKLNTQSVRLIPALTHKPLPRTIPPLHALSLVDHTVLSLVSSGLPQQPLLIPVLPAQRETCRGHQHHLHTFRDSPTAARRGTCSSMTAPCLSTAMSGTVERPHSQAPTSLTAEAFMAVGADILVFAVGLAVGVFSSSDRRLFTGDLVMGMPWKRTT